MYKKLVFPLTRFIWATLFFSLSLPIVILIYSISPRIYGIYLIKRANVYSKYLRISDLKKYPEAWGHFNKCLTHDKAKES